ncbi:hypothetical protein LguiB_021260 [Lonicera macranthoides]
MAKYSFSLSRALTLCLIFTLVIFIPTLATGEKMKFGNRKSGGEAIGDSKLKANSGFERRALAGSKGYVSYGALDRDNVPCSRRGDSFKNCQPQAQKHDYSRGCENIDRCRH